MSHKVAIAVGHSRIQNGRIEGGAVSTGKVSEHAYNSDLAVRIQSELFKLGIGSFIVSKYQGGGYTAAQKWLASELKSRGATFALELHFNSAGEAATGHEWLFWGSSSKGRLAAKELDESFAHTFPDLARRGIKPKGSGDRGAEFLKLTHCPAVIGEPFFGSNPGDWKLATERKNDIALAYAKGIQWYLDQ